MNRDIRLLGNASNTSHADTDAHRINEGEAIDDRPRSVYELVTRRMLEELKSDLDEVKGRVNTLLWLTVGAVLLDFIMRIAR